MNFFSEVKKRPIVIIIGILIFYVAFAVFYDTREFLEGDIQINYYLVIPILLIFLFGLVMKSMRQFIFLKHLGITIPIKENIIMYFSGLAMLFTPGGAGEMIKSHYLKKKYGHLMAKTIPVVIVERYHDALAIFSLIIIFSMVTKTTFLNIPIAIVAIILVVGIIMVRKKEILNSFVKLVAKTKIFSKIKTLENFEEQSQGMNESLKSFSSPKVFFSGWAVGFTAWTIDAFGIFLCFQAFGLDLDFFTTTIVGMSSILFGAMTLLPGGVGLTEVSFVELLSVRGIDSSLSSSLALFFRLATIWFSTLIGIIATRFALK